MVEAGRVSGGIGVAGGDGVRIDAVLLDVGGVFTTPNHEALGAVIEAAGGRPTPEALDRGH